jgi:hypothetical protein
MSLAVDVIHWMVGALIGRLSQRYRKSPLKQSLQPEAILTSFFFEFNYVGVNSM